MSSQEGLCEQAQQGTDLCIAGVCIEYIAEKLAGNCDSSDNETMNIIRVDNEGPAGRIGSELAHPVKVDEKAKKNFIRSRTVF
jgi:hypothetical protein